MKKLNFIMLIIALNGSLLSFGCNTDHRKSSTLSNAAAGIGGGAQTVSSADSNAAGLTKNPDPTADKIESIYTNLAADKCRTIESEDSGAGWYRGECVGVGGYKLEVLEGDLRQTVNIISPNGTTSELEFWTKVSGAFSYIGDKAEWRVTKNREDIKPLGLIIRYNTSEDPEKPDKETSRLVVIKISGDSACITDVVEPVKDANEKARKLADASAYKPCK